MAITPQQPIRNARVVSRVPEILRLCEGRRVLHLGCADVPYTVERGESLLHKRLSAVTAADDLWGVDLDENGVRLLRDMGFDHVLAGDCEELAETLRQERFDIVLAGEIIEHVANAGRFLEAIRAVMVERTELLLTTVNAGAIKTFLHGGLSREKVHPDHHYYFSYHTLRQLLARFDLECVDICYYQEVEGRGLGRARDRALSWLAATRPPWSDGLIVRARL